MVDTNRPHRYYDIGMGLGIVGGLTALYFVGSDVVNYIHSNALVAYAANPENRAVVKVTSGALEIMAGLTIGHFAGTFLGAIAERSNRKQLARESPFNSALSAEAIKAMRERSDSKKK